MLLIIEMSAKYLKTDTGNLGVGESPRIRLTMKGETDTFEYRVHAVDTQQQDPVSLWHDINLYPSIESKDLKICNMINEVMLTIIRLFTGTNVMSLTYAFLDRFLGAVERSMRSLPTSPATPSSRTSRKASSESFPRATYTLTTAAYRRHGKTQLMSILTPRLKATMTRLMYARSAYAFSVSARSLQ